MDRGALVEPPSEHIARPTTASTPTPAVTLPSSGQSHSCVTAKTIATVTPARTVVTPSFHVSRIEAPPCFHPTLVGRKVAIMGRRTLRSWVCPTGGENDLAAGPAALVVAVAFGCLIQRRFPQGALAIAFREAPRTVRITDLGYRAPERTAPSATAPAHGARRFHAPLVVSCLRVWIQEHEPASRLELSGGRGCSGITVSKELPIR